MILNNNIKEIIQALANGKALKEIAADKGVSTAAICNYLKIAREVNECPNNMTLVLLALKENEIQWPSHLNNLKSLEKRA